MFVVRELKRPLRPGAPPQYSRTKRERMRRSATHQVCTGTHFHRNGWNGCTECTTLNRVWNIAGPIREESHAVRPDCQGECRGFKSLHPLFRPLASPDARGLCLALGVRCASLISNICVSPGTTLVVHRVDGEEGRLWSRSDQ
jgi:hypothetical protein